MKIKNSYKLHVYGYTEALFKDGGWGWSDLYLEETHRVKGKTPKCWKNIEMLSCSA